LPAFKNRAAAIGQTAYLPFGQGGCHKHKRLPAIDQNISLPFEQGDLLSEQTTWSAMQSVPRMPTFRSHR